MDAITFKYSSDFITIYNLAEYARYITGINDITVEFVEEKAYKSPCVELGNKIIYLPKIDYINNLDSDIFRIIKTYLCHECAHLMYQEEKYKYTIPKKWKKHFWFLGALVNTIVDLRIENLIGIKHKELRDDFKFLIEYHWKELYIHYANDNDMGYGRYGDFSFDMSGSLYWLLQKRYRRANLISPYGCGTSFPFKTIEGMEQLFENELVPVLDIFINSEKSSWETAVKMLNILKKNYPEIFETSPEKY